MNSAFESLHRFDIDCRRLYLEWIAIAEKNRLFERATTYPLMLVTYPSSHDEYIDIVDFPNQIGVDNFFNIAHKFTIDNVVKDFQNTYTEEVINQIKDYIQINLPMYRPSIIKYAAQSPNSQMRLHKDQHPRSLLPRLLLAVDVPTGCFMQVEETLHPLDNNGSLFILDRTRLHSPINRSNQYRLLLHFDLEQI